jgi:PilZ domain-containing protein
MKNRRRAKRIPSILEGRIAAGNQQPYISCTIRNLSATGAQIWLPGDIDLPNEFELEIPRFEQSVRVRIAWSEARSHGVMFLTPLRSYAGEDVTSLLEALQTPARTTSPETPKEMPVKPSPRQPRKPGSLWRRFLGFLSRGSR